MERIKKILAMALTLSMIMGMSTMAFAENTKPQAADKTSVSVSNVEKTATVTAYQIVSACYNDQGFTGYKSVKEGIISDSQTYQPTAEEIAAIAQDTAGLTPKTLTAANIQGDFADFTGELEAGYWMVLVTGTVKEVYNPMLIGVYYDVDGSGESNHLNSEPVDANKNWTLKATNPYAKSTAPSIDKEMVESDGNSNGGDVAIGDDVQFKITSDIPSYSKQYDKVIVKITDELSKGLSLNESSIAVSINGNPVGESNYSIDTTKSGFTISLNSDYAIQNGGKKVVITYSAELTDDAGVNFDPNTNTAKLVYTNSPTDEATTGSANDTTYTYTFALDSQLYGEYNIQNNKVTTEISKVGEDVKTENGETKTEQVTLSGAEFKLTHKTTNKEYTEISDAQGRLAFTGLQAGEYTLVETKAPKGYSLDSTPHTVKISASYNGDGTLASYEIKIDGKVTGSYTATYNGEPIVKTVTELKIVSENTMNIKNTKLASLPSTGGIGTTIFTVVGCIIMIAAAGLFFASRRRSSSQQQ